MEFVDETMNFKAFQGIFSKAAIPPKCEGVTKQEQWERYFLGICRKNLLIPEERIIAFPEFIKAVLNDSYATDTDRVEACLIYILDLAEDSCSSRLWPLEEIDKFKLQIKQDNFESWLLHISITKPFNGA